MARKKSSVAKRVDERHQAIHKKWTDRNPRLAREERALRLANARLEEDWGHKVAGTPETHQKASGVQQGALARLYASGSIDADQLFNADDIRRVAERIGRDVAVGSMSLEARVDQSHGDGGFFEKLGAVRAEIAYTAWRASLAAPAPVLAMIVEDLSCSAVAQRFRRDTRTIRKLLIDSLDAWPGFRADARREVDEATLLAAQAAIL